MGEDMVLTAIVMSFAPGRADGCDCWGSKRENVYTAYTAAFHNADASNQNSGCGRREVQSAEKWGCKCHSCYYCIDTFHSHQICLNAASLLSMSASIQNAIFARHDGTYGQRRGERGTSFHSFYDDGAVGIPNSDVKIDFCMTSRLLDHTNIK